jgi:MinD-like ATPase involved in chromosome partitioning or flagellar assembly
MHYFFSVKGGSGTTVTAAATALALAERHGRALIVDLCGDVPAALGMSEPTSPGINDWLNEHSTADDESLLLLSHPADLGLLAVHRGSEAVLGLPRWAELASILESLPMPVVVDAGTRHIPDEFVDMASERLLVIRPCYLSLRRAISVPRAHGVVLVNEAGRALTAHDVESVLTTKVVATIPYDAAVSRAVDAGLLAARMPALLRRHLPLH